MSDLNWDNATHLLACVHAIGNSRKGYMMRCHIVKEMPDGRLKIRVYGERYWNDGRNDKVSFRYVNAKEGANKRGNSSRLTQSFHFFMFEPIFFSRKCLESAYLDRFFAI